MFVHDAIVYMSTEDDLRAAMATARAHLRPGGVALFVPDQVRERFQAHTTSGGRDGKERSLRYLEWVHDPEEGASTYVTTYVYLLKEGDGPVRVLSEDHVMGLFSLDTWLGLLAEAGLEPRALPYDGSSFSPPVRSAFLLGYRPGS